MIDVISKSIAVYLNFPRTTRKFGTEVPGETEQELATQLNPRSELTGLPYEVTGPEAFEALDELLRTEMGNPDEKMLASITISTLNQRSLGRG